MTRWVEAVGLIFALLVGAAACGGGRNPVGGPDITNFTPQPSPSRLGGPSPTPDALPTPTQANRTPSPSPSPPPEHFFDVALTAESPYFVPGNAITIQGGVTLRVTNRDATPERPTRSFTAKDGTFDSGPLATGVVWTQRFDSPGFWDIIDSRAPFILATLEVV